MTTLWDTTGSAVVKELAAQRRTGGAVLSGVARHGRRHLRSSAASISSAARGPHSPAR